MYVIILKSQNKLFIDGVVKTIIISNIFFIGVCLISFLLGKAIIPTITLLLNGKVYVNFDLFKVQDLTSGVGSLNRIGGIFGLGPIGIANIVLIQSFFINYKIRNSFTFRERILYLLLFSGNVIIIVLTYSRAGLIIFIILHGITLFGKNIKNNILYIILGLCILAIFLISFPNVTERLLETFNLEEASTKYHLVFWIAAIKLGFNRILTGIGLGMSKYSLANFAEYFRSFGIYKVNSVDMHNILLQVWAEQGIFGLLISVVMLFSPIISYVKFSITKKTKEKTIYYFIIMAYVATFLYNLTNNNFYIESFWIMLALVYAGKHNSFQLSNTEQETR